MQTHVSAVTAWQLVTSENLNTATATRHTERSNDRVRDHVIEACRLGSASASVIKVSSTVIALYVNQGWWYWKNTGEQ
jgi:hypothetical protein